MKTKPTNIPKFKSESEEADWWASNAGREYVKQQSAAARSNNVRIEGSALLTSFKKKSVQIAIRLPEADLARARKIADKKGMGYQTFLKMLVHEGLARESRRG
jgi:predicted DNA binding CopG/RHH family protein